MRLSATETAEDPTCGVPLRPLSDFLAPRWWPVWVALGLIRILASLPWPLQTRLARGLGRIAWQLARRDRRVTLINLRLAYPGMTERERRALGRRHFESLVYSLFETGLVWFGDRARLASLVTLEGVEYLQAARARGKGVLLVGAHFTTNEIAATALSLTDQQLDIMYKPSQNALINQLALRGRIRHGARMIPSDRFVELLKVMKRGGIALYAPDQRFEGEGHVVAPLFGVPALSNPGTTFIARATRCAVLCYFTERLADGSGYRMTISPPQPDFPSDDKLRDVTRYHALIEAAARRAPEQYLWSYKRFRPTAGAADPYRRGAPRGIA
jgi:KDO2-lipid IV(A) lauroyltransferase